MSDFGVYYMELGFIALVVLTIGGGIIATYRRRKALIAWVRSHGFQHQPKIDEKIEERFSDLECLRQGRNRWGYDVVSGQWNGRQFVAFNYRYRTGRKKKGRPIHFTLLGLKTARPLKRLSIRREHLLDKAAGLFGYKDVQFDSPEFDRRFHVASDDPDWARQLVNPIVQQFLISSSPYQMATCGEYLFAWDKRLWRPERYEAAANYLTALLQRLGH